MRFLLAVIISFAMLCAMAEVSMANQPVFPGRNEGRSSAKTIVRETSSISFGTFTAGNNGSITVDPRSGTCTGRGGIVVVKQNCARGVIELHGAPGDQVMLTLPSQTTMQGNGAMAEMGDFTMDHENPVIIGPDGRTNVGIGATLRGAGGRRAGQLSAQYFVLTTVLKE